MGMIKIDKEKYSKTQDENRSLKSKNKDQSKEIIELTLQNSTNSVEISDLENDNTELNKVIEGHLNSIKLLRDMLADQTDVHLKKRERLKDKYIELNISLDEALLSIATYKQSNNLYKGNLDKIPNWVKWLYKV